jgi:hypothetical protein
MATRRAKLDNPDGIITAGLVGAAKRYASRKPLVVQARVAESSERDGANRTQTNARRRKRRLPVRLCEAACMVAEVASHDKSFNAEFLDIELTRPNSFRSLPKPGKSRDGIRVITFADQGDRVAGMAPINTAILQNRV